MLHLGLYKHHTLNCVAHRTLLKVVFNPILRWIQFWTDRPYVITSIFENAKFKNYTVTRVKYLGPFDPKVFNKIGDN